MSEKSSETELETIHKEALDRFDEVFELEKDQRTKAIEDAIFVHSEDGQWEEEATTKRKGRPRYTIDRTSGAIDQTTGDQRQNPTQIKVRPVTNGSKDVAKVEMGLIRNIEQRSKAQGIYSYAYKETVTGGYGGWRVLTEFADDDSFEQDIFLEVIKSAASSLFLDPNARKFDNRDAMYGFVVRELTTTKFKELYPNATVTDFSNELYTSSTCSHWFQGDKIRIGEYWRVKLIDTEIALMSDGTVIDLKEEEKVIDELAVKGITVVDKRKTQKREVESYIMNGAEILKGPMPWAGKYIPLVLVKGRSYNIEGKEYARGLVRKAKDPQRIYNYASSTAIETAALSPKDPYWLTPKQANGHEAKLRSFNTMNNPFMLFNADPENPGPPTRTGAPAVQNALIQQVAQASDDLHATTGLFAPAMGNAPQLLSEKAVIAQADKGDRGVYDFTASLSEGINLTGDILVDLMPRIYDTQRTVRALNFDGTTENVEVNAKGIDEFNNPILDEETGEQVIVNDLSRGKYETYIETGPAFSTLRQESAQQLIDLATGSPVFEQLATDLIAKNLNILENEELTKRVRKMMIEQGTVTPTEEEVEELGLGQPQEPSPEQQALLENIQTQTAEIVARVNKLNAQTDGEDAKTAQTNIDSQKIAIDAYKSLVDAYKIQQETGIPLGLDEHMLKEAQQGIIGLTQEGLVEESI